MRGKFKLTVLGIENAPAGKYGDGDGLWIKKHSKRHGNWYWLYTIGGHRREMGLGGWPAVGLKAARESVELWRGVLKSGGDPITERNRQKLLAERSRNLFRDVLADCFENHKHELKGGGEAGRWLSPLNTHVLPRLGHLPITGIDQVSIRDCLKPIWNTKPSVARKAITRIGIVLNHAAALGLPVDMQAVDKAKALLGRQIHVERHIPSMPYAEVPAFYQSLTNETPTTYALKLLILTGVRSGPIRNLQLEQIQGDTWIIPAAAQKGRVGKTSDFRVPLSNEALQVIEDAKRLSYRGLLFPSIKRDGGVISDASMSKLMSLRGLDYRPHGFRSSLREWAEFETTATYEVKETLLSHVVGGSTERAYRRSDYLDQRRQLLDNWSLFITGKLAATNGKVINLISK